MFTVGRLLRIHIEKEEDDFNKFHSDILDLKEELKKLSIEMSFNGGKSLKDLILKTYNLSLRSKDRLYLLMDSNSTPMFECDETGKCTWANTALCELFGMDRSDMLDNGWLKGIHDDDRDRVFTTWMNSVSKGIPYSCDYRIYNKQTKQTILCRAETLSIKNGQWFHGTIIPIK